MRTRSSFGVILVVVLSALFLNGVFFVPVVYADIETIRPTDAYNPGTWATPANGYDASTSTSASKLNINTDPDPSISFGGSVSSESTNAWQTKSNDWTAATIYITFSRAAPTPDDDWIKVLVTDQNGVLKHTIVAQTTGAVTKQTFSQALNSGDWGGAVFPNIDNLRVRVIGKKNKGSDGSTSYMYDIRIDGTYTFSNSPPTVSSVNLNADIIITLTENTTATIDCTATLSDDNGGSDITSATSTVYRSGVTDTCSADNNNCYLITSGSCSLGAPVGNDRSATCSTDIWFHADPTDSGTYNADTWACKVTATDTASATGSNTDGTPPELETLLALNVSPDTVLYGTLTPTQDSGTLSESVTVTTTGNTAIDVNLSGTNMMSGSDTILVGYQEYATSAVSYGSGTELTESPARLELDSTKPTDNSPSNQSDDAYWGIGIPSGTPMGSYEGTNTFSAVAD